MLSLTNAAHELIAQTLRPGDIAVDATVGNGHDTLFLAQCVGPQGHVYGFDIQPSAIDTTQQRLAEQHVHHATLFTASHARLKELLPPHQQRQFAVLTFNLGYLPGGDKSITTHASSTCAAIEQAARLLRPGGLITILAYIGHHGGADEARHVIATLAQLGTEFIVSEPYPATNPIAPRLFTVRRQVS